MANGHTIKVSVTVDVGPDMWQPIETAPKGGGAEMVTDPDWVEPPEILIYCANGEQVVARWDLYYAEGGRGYTDGVAWVAFGEQVNSAIGEPTHWRPLPSPPTERH